MKIKEIENKDLHVNKVEMDCDKCIKDSKGKSIADPLMNTSHFYIINGASGMGKSNLIVSLLKSNKITKDKKAKLSYRKMFDKVIFVSPSAATIKDSPLEKIADDQKFDELNSEVFDLLEELGDDAVEENKHNLWIVGHKITDLAPSLRSNANMIFLFKPKTNKEVTAIQEEYMLMSKKQAEQIFDATYKSRYDFLLIDTSLRTSADFRFFRNYNQLIFEEEEDKNENVG